MENKQKQLLAAFCLGALLPGLTLRLPGRFRKEEAPETPTAVQTQPPAENGQALRVPVLTGDGTVTEMELDLYLTGVVLAEMPASFSPEALKAQAVAARTYALRCQQAYGKHEGGAVCTDSTCCQAYLSERDYLDQGGSQEDAEKIRSAVETTANQVLTYNGELIEATYFSCSGGRTEDAVAVWGAEVPYLQSVDSPGEEWAEPYTHTVSFTPEELAALLGRSLTGAPKYWFGYPTYTEGGGVASITVCGETYTGTQLRQLLGLNSTAFTVNAENDRITFTTAGKGHRVGMSQYGAEAMAQRGCGYAQILNYYYPGTRIDKVSALG